MVHEICPKKAIEFMAKKKLSNAFGTEEQSVWMVGLGVGAARHHGVQHHGDSPHNRHHSHTDKATPESGLMDKDESNKDEEGTLRILGPRDGLLPPPSERILTGILEKKTMTSKGLHWKKRNAVLSRDYLSFGKVVEDWYVRARRCAKFSLSLSLSLSLCLPLSVFVSLSPSLKADNCTLKSLAQGHHHEHVSGLN
jgi:hypothetical protein